MKYSCIHFEDIFKNKNLNLNPAFQSQARSVSRRMMYRSPVMRLSLRAPETTEENSFFKKETTEAKRWKKSTKRAKTLLPLLRSDRLARIAWKDGLCVEGGDFEATFL